ncbi:hypothetical protein A0J61_03536 [Choanephora cucurbitarum]|uniref:Uncharacterized protein n=1 Tax=Choanephora cucurbitarum TaxID=101091 RepID=A0A1C7NHB1_9FUNG|nr:hypothetical protein A0J61_03536 [Choanephora cucurbitarum]
MSEQVIYPKLALEFPCLACPYVANNPPQILEHYQRCHDFKVDIHALPLQTTTQYACPLCLSCMEPSPNALYTHYQNDHDLTMLIEGDKVKEDVSKRRQRHAEEREKEKEMPRVMKQEETEDEEEEERDELEEPEEPEEEESSEKKETIQKINELIEMFGSFVKTMKPAS